MPQWIADIISVWPALGALALALFVVSLAWKYIRPIARKVDTAMDDFNGRPARPGVPAQPGFMERFATIEEWTRKYGPVIDKLDHEMHPNSGSSMADAVNRTERSLNEHIASCPALAPVPATTINVNTPGA
jgi:hypothetical protein